MIGKLLKKQSGQAMVELAIVLPILLLLVFGIIEFGRIYSTQLMAAHGAREGARAASVGATDNEIISIIGTRAFSTLDKDQLIIEIFPTQLSRQRGDGVSVKIQYPVKIFAPIISNFLGETYIVKSEVIMRVE